MIHVIPKKLKLRVPSSAIFRMRKDWGRLLILQMLVLLSQWQGEEPYLLSPQRMLFSEFCSLTKVHRGVTQLPMWHLNCWTERCWIQLMLVEACGISWHWNGITFICHKYSNNLVNTNNYELMSCLLLFYCQILDSCVFKQFIWVLYKF